MLDYYYHGTIRKVVVAFASMFNDIYVSRKDANGNEIERFKVPIAYGPKQKFLGRLDRMGTDLEARVKLESYLPRLSFEITNLQYDSSRKLNTIQKTVDKYVWRIDLTKTEKYWKDWFKGLSGMFLNVNVPKLLLLAGVDRLDRELMVGQMQGKFQMQVLPQCGHAVHEVANALSNFVIRNKITESILSDEQKLSLPRLDSC